MSQIKFIKICVDSQAALAALCAQNVTSKLVLEAISSLNAIPSSVTIRLVWVKAHVGIAGNEAADALAKAGCALPLGEAFSTRLPKQEIRTQISHKIYQLWTEEWRAYPLARQSKQFYDKPSVSRAREAYKLSRSKLGRLIKITTGHNNLNYHQSKLHPDRDALCRFCQEEPETFFHLSTSCPAFRISQQEQGLGENFRSTDWHIDDVLSFSFLPSINRALTYQPNADTEEPSDANSSTNRVDEEEEPDRRIAVVSVVTGATTLPTQPFTPGSSVVVSMQPEPTQDVDSQQSPNTTPQGLQTGSAAFLPPD